MKVILSFIIIFTLILISIGFSATINRPKYKLIKKDRKFEIREYTRKIIIKVFKKGGGIL